MIMNRNGRIDFLRFCFSIIVVLYHGGVFLGGWIGVEFFFIVSGYYMCRSYESGKYSDTLSFVKHKFFSLLPNVYIAWIIAVIVNHLNTHSITIIVRDIFFSLPELAFLSQIGISNGLQNDTTWYLSAMLIAMIVLYTLIVKYGVQKFIHVIAPLITLVGIAYMQQKFNCINVVKDSVWFVSGGLIRALAEISMGATCYGIVKRINKYHYTKLAKILCICFESLIYVMVFVSSKFDIGGATGITLLFLLAMATTITFSDIRYNEFFNNKICFWLGEYSFSLYLSHATWGYYFNNKNNSMGEFCLYLVFSVIFGLIIMYVSKALRIWWCKHKGEIIKLIMI